jgi:cell shape-determining protein MreD
MANYLSVPIVGILLILQMTIFSRIEMLQGTADVVLLGLIGWSIQGRVQSAWIWAVAAGVMVSYVSALPFFLPLFIYLAVYFLTRMLQRRVWQAPILAVLFVTMIGTVFQHLVSILALNLSGVDIPISESLTKITFPSVLLNLIFCIPFYLVMVDLAKLVFPQKAEL